MSTNPDSDPPTDEAFAALVHSHQDAVWRYLRFLGCAPEDASELTQETFLAVHGRALDRFGDGGARAYLRRVARNMRLKLLRREALRKTEPLDVEAEMTLGEAAYEWQRGEDEGASYRTALQHCLGELASKARRALELRFGEDPVDRAAIAAQLNMSGDGVKSLLQRSYAKLRFCIERHAGGLAERGESLR